MSAHDRRPRRAASALILAVAAAAAPAQAADDVFVERGVVVKPLPKWKQRHLERKVLRHPGSQVVIEGRPTVAPGPDALSSVRSRRAFRPMFPGLFDRRNEYILEAPIVTAPGVVVAGPGRPAVVDEPEVEVLKPAPGAIVSAPRSTGAPGDPLVLPGSAEEAPAPRVVRPPVVSTPRGTTPPPVDLPDEPELQPERRPTSRALPPPADEIPPPVVSAPRPGLNPAPSSPSPAPAGEPLPTPTLPGSPSLDPATPPAPSPEPVDPGPPPAPSSGSSPAPEPVSAPTPPRLDPPQPAPRPA